MSNMVQLIVVDRRMIERKTEGRDTYDEDNECTVSEVVCLSFGYATLEGWPDGSWSVHAYGSCLGVLRDGEWYGADALYGS